VLIAVLSAPVEPTRLVARRLLVGGPEHCVCELLRELGATQSRMSHHLRILSLAGLVIDCHSAQGLRYWINPKPSPIPARLIEGALAGDPAVSEAAA
jgi:ArsR family transcriptional regulator